MATYQGNMYPNYIPQGGQVPIQVPNQVPNNSNIYWVQGIEGAKGYPVANGSNLALWDSENQCIYIKSVDSSGLPQPLRILDYTERVQTPVSTEPANYVTVDQLNDILDSKLSALAESLKPRNNRKKGGWNDGKSTVQPTERQ